MIRKALLAATVASGLIVPVAAAGLYVPPKPAIVKPDNIEFSKHMLLGMPITMGMLAKSTSASTPVTLINRETTVGTFGGGATVTVSGRSIGAASSTRKVIALITAHSNSVAGSLSSVTIGGVTATIDATTQIGSGNTSIVGIASATVPAGTTADVVCTFSSSLQGGAVSVVAIDNLQSTTPVAATTNAGTGTVRSTTIDWNAGGYVIGVIGAYDSRTYSWTQLTEQYDNTYTAVATRSVSMADLFPTTSATASTVTATLSSSSFRSVMAVVSYR